MGGLAPHRSVAAASIGACRETVKWQFGRSGNLRGLGKSAADGLPLGGQLRAKRVSPIRANIRPLS